MADKEQMNWETFDKACECLVRILAEKDTITSVDAIYGLPRGGLVVAVKLSHLTGLPLILDECDITPKTLIVDDIADSGKTLMELNDNLIKRGKCPLWKMKTGTLYYCEQSVFKPTASVFLKSKWVVFPWETKDSTKTSSKKA